jgi:1-deoxy-D-xylulose-5-phosphate reductoisomerase
MGRKITVDSATLANKALEVIEAHYLFGLEYDNIEVVVHPQSIVHAFAEFVDGSVLAQVGFPTMELPILYALTYPDRVQDQAVPRFDPVGAGSLTFEPVREDAFRTFLLGVAAGRAGGTAPAVFNAANEVAVEAFLAGRILFGDIPVVIDKVLQKHELEVASDLDTVIGKDRWAREETEAACS